MSASEFKTGMYGPDDLPWELYDAKDRAENARYRLHKEEADNDVRLQAKTDLLYAHLQDGNIYQDGENQLHLGFESHGNVYLFGLIDPVAQTIKFAPLVKAQRLIVVWAPLCQFEIHKFKKTAPKGCI